MSKAPIQPRVIDQIDVQVGIAVNQIRRMHNEAQARLNLQITQHRRSVAGE